jgi:hypothetical protein
VKHISLNFTIRLLIALSFLIFSFLPVESQTKWALIIGIGAYPVESGWYTIHGDNDVPLISNALIQRGFNQNNIITLINEQATKKNILKKFDELKVKSHVNDIIYIHFSTHGQQVVDLDGDEEDGLDEAIIPYDACKTFVSGVYEGKNHLIDDELYKLLSALRRKIGKSGSILVVLDACHSGDATRGNSIENDSICVRGTDEIFQAGPMAKFSAAKLKTINWVVISATQSYQNNYEYRSNESYYGSLSYAIKLALEEITNENDLNSMFRLIQKKRTDMNVSRYPQRPMIEGDIYYLNQKVF